MKQTSKKTECIRQCGLSNFKHECLLIIYLEFRVLISFLVSVEFRILIHGSCSKINNVLLIL